MAKLLKEANRIITLWRKYGPGGDKIDLESVFNEVVLPASSGDSCEIKYDEFDAFEGLMAREGNARKWVIGINKGIPYAPRRNFTLAHEIGHFIGHRYKRQDFQCSFEDLNDFQDEILEKEANDFAAHLLMPPDIIRKFDSERIFSHEVVVELAERQGVSRAAAAYRWVGLSNRRVGFVISRDGFFTQGRASEKAYKEGVFFRQGDEVPSRSVVTSLSVTGRRSCTSVDGGVWHPNSGCHETSYVATVGDYIYTYLDFDQSEMCSERSAAPQ
ncbi:ImmA/IrrE family metallo-endopeptidase [Nitratireductor sp. GISD-1A_MAKvit]|uniref:ImmA/IrrE family metallo-endopeptidase n=1 Tax=Nitratireductor sp. GISD-1A_MAKvit TaxID=3234198 RepID=UPI00346767FC